MSITSTVPGAITTLLGYFADVASANPSLDVGVYSGLPIANIKNNYLSIGEWETGSVLSGYRQDWVGFPASASPKLEDYSINCVARAWDGSSDTTAIAQRFTDAFTLLDGVMGCLQADPGASGSITPSGTWQVVGVDNIASGPLGGKGFGVLLSFEVQVINVRITS